MLLGVKCITVVLTAVEMCSRQGTIQIHVYLTYLIISVEVILAPSGIRAVL